MYGLSNFFKLIATTFATIPGLAVLLTNIGVPPDTSIALFAGTIEAIGILTLLIIWLKKKWIVEQPLNRIIRIGIFMAILFLISLFSYLFLFSYLVIEYPDSQPLLFPIYAQGELQAGLSKYGSPFELIHQWGRDDVYKTIQKSSNVAKNITVLCFLLIYQFIFVSLTGAFAILGLRCKESEQTASD